MTPAPTRGPQDHRQHLVLDGISWGTYERLLAELGNGAVRVTFDNGDMEMMAPLAEHEGDKKAISRLLEILIVELAIPAASFGSTTFRIEAKQRGLEPDECYYFANEARVRGMKDFDPGVHPPPDLAIEIDTTRRSIAREPVYEGLGIPELWRYDGGSLRVRLLNEAGGYRDGQQSGVLPFLPMDRFATFIPRLNGSESQTAVLREFRDWARTLSPVG